MISMIALRVGSRRSRFGFCAGFCAGIECALHLDEVPRRSIEERVVQCASRLGLLDRRVRGCLQYQPQR